MGAVRCWVCYNKNMGKELDLTNYKQMKADGLWEVVQTPKGIAIKAKKFDPLTGEETEPDYYYLDVEEVTKVKDTAVRTADNFAQLVSDIGEL